MKEETKVVKVVEVAPQYYAQRCPSCNGFGTNGYEKVTCRICKGEGFIKVPVKVLEKRRER